MPLLSALTDTWASSGTTFDAIKMNVTDTGHAAASTLLNLQLNGTSQFTVDGSGYGAFGAGGNQVRAFNVPSALQLTLAAATGYNLDLLEYTNQALGPSIRTLKNRSGTPGGLTTALSDGDDLLAVWCYGSDGTGYNVAAQLLAEVEGTVSAGITPGRWKINTTDSTGTINERLRIDSAGRVSIGGVAAWDATARLQTAGNNVDATGRSITLGYFNNNAPSSTIILRKSRNTTIGSHTIVQSGDGLGIIMFYGSDGANWQLGAQINSDVDGSPAAGIVPGRIILYTADTTGAVNERMRLDKAGNVTINTAAISTSATDGFLYIPTCAGAPSGMPTSYTGRVPIVYDTTNHKLWAYDSGWKGVVLS